jgi:hypothetical protein
MNAPMQPDRLTARPGATDPRPRGMAIRPTPRLSRRRAFAVAGLLVLMRALHAGLRVCAQTVDTLEGRRL